MHATRIQLRMVKVNECDVPPLVYQDIIFANIMMVDAPAVQ
jgi:hypothetical protein